MESTASAAQAGAAHAAALQSPATSPASAGHRGNGMQSWRGRLLFALGFLRHPLRVGTLFQSSPALVRRLSAATDWGRCRCVVELGPGVGTVTGALLPMLRSDALLLAIEDNAAFAAELRRSLPDPRLRVEHGSAAQLATLLRRHGIAHVDALISGIPFSTLAEPVRIAVLDAAVAALAPDGELVAYQHTALLLPLLRQRFGEVQVATEWRSLVPMRVFRCRHPR